MEKKLSASTIKHLVKDPIKFEYHFLPQQTYYDDFKIALNLGKAFHSIMENYINTGEYSLEHGIKYYQDYMDTLEIGLDVTQEEYDEAITKGYEAITWGRDNFKNEYHKLKGQPELPLKLDNYVGFIDLYNDGVIVDYKLVKNLIKPGSKFDKDYGIILSYIIQGALYSYRASIQGVENPIARFIEIKKVDTTISIEELGSYKKDELILLCPDYNEEDFSKEFKSTKENILTKYRPRDQSFQVIEFKGLVEIGKWIYENCSELRDMIIKDGINNKDKKIRKAKEIKRYLLDLTNDESIYTISNNLEQMPELKDKISIDDINLEEDSLDFW